MAERTCQSAEQMIRPPAAYSSRRVPGLAARFDGCGAGVIVLFFLFARFLGLFLGLVALFFIICLLFCCFCSSLVFCCGLVFCSCVSSAHCGFCLLDAPLFVSPSLVISLRSSMHVSICCTAALSLFLFASAVIPLCSCCIACRPLSIYLL